MEWIFDRIDAAAERARAPSPGEWLIFGGLAAALWRTADIRAARLKLAQFAALRPPTWIYVNVGLLRFAFSGAVCIGRWKSGFLKVMVLYMWLMVLFYDYVRWGSEEGCIWKEKHHVERHRKGL